jgi:DNA replication protein DnaC
LIQAKTLLERMQIAAQASKRTDEAIAAEREAYLQLLKARADELDAGGSADDFRARMVRLGCPKEIVGSIADADRLDDKPALAAAKRFIGEECDDLFLVLLGPPGCGKSVAAGFVLADFVRQWRWGSQMTGGNDRPPAMFVQASDLTRVSAFGPEHGEWLKNMKSCHLLVLDDAGDEATESGKTELAAVLLARERSLRETVLTANLRPEMVRGRYGVAVADRLNRRTMAPNLWGEQSMRRRM